MEAIIPLINRTYSLNMRFRNHTFHWSINFNEDTRKSRYIINKSTNIQFFCLATVYEFIREGNYLQTGVNRGLYRQTTKVTFNLLLVQKLSSTVSSLYKCSWETIWITEMKRLIQEEIHTEQGWLTGDGFRCNTNRDGLVVWRWIPNSAPGREYIESRTLEWWALLFYKYFLFLLLCLKHFTIN